MRKAWLIYNPFAGRFPAGPLLSRAVRVLTESDWEIEVMETEQGQQLSDLALKAVGVGCDAVFVAGGDGSVGKVAAALAGRDTALGVLPSGTANVWAHELGLAGLDWTHWFALEDAATRLAQGQVRSVDLGVCDEYPFLLWAGVGLDASIVNSVEPRDRWEKALAMVHYATMAVWTSLGWEGIDLVVRANGESWEGRFLVAIASNIRGYAGGLLELSPRAMVDDGLLDFWLIEGRSITDAVLRVGQILLGTHVDSPGVVHFQTDEAVFESERAISMQLDGEPLTLERSCKFSVRPRTLNVIVPRPGGPQVFTRGTAADRDLP
jgi:YegS/Rv2252/BmrU family lipid kinase